jgi:hypothetical protein
MKPQVHPNDLRNATALLIDNVKRTKSRLVNLIEGGERDWKIVREAFERYVEFQSAADVLNGYVVLSDAKDQDV